MTKQIFKAEENGFSILDSRGYSKLGVVGKPTSFYLYDAYEPSRFSAWSSNQRVWFSLKDVFNTKDLYDFEKEFEKAWNIIQKEN